ncbi:MAG TPA: type IV pili twitching motility protein PilT, partial [Acidobacteria bacterium]|nr:type IV pili twitching motility protein PilT [Acidobacteriota bacterium]
MSSPPLRRIDRFLQMMRDRGASDLHLSVGRPPMLRVSGDLEPVRFRVLDDDQFRAMIEPITPSSRWKEYLHTGDTDFAYELPGVARFRVNLFRQQRGMGAVFRVIPTRIMGLEELGLPPQVSSLADLDGGLVLVTGPTGSGKSTTLAALIDRISSTHEYHIITIEDPIEFVYPVRRSLIHQREIGSHASSFSEALRAAVREDPDLVLVGELRDLETIAMALSAAERGIIVYATLHTNSASKTV